MAEKGTKRTQPQARNRGATPHRNPAEAARRELIEWCQAHQIPVPAEHRPQGRGPIAR
jgi:hypothetical protein